MADQPGEMIGIESLYKWFGPLCAVNNVSFTMPHGRVLDGCRGDRGAQPPVSEPDFAVTFLTSVNLPEVQTLREVFCSLPTGVY